MRLSLPERVSISKVLLFAAALMLLQLYQHTSFAFAILFFGFTLCSACVFNLAGGFTRAIGAYIFWFATLVPYIGVFWKSVVGEPAQSNLKTPLLDLTAYIAAMVMLGIVSIITAKIDLRPIGMSATSPPLNYKLAASGCMAFWFFMYIIGGFFVQYLYTLYSVFRQVDFFRQLAIILGTIAVIRESGGRRSVSVLTAIAILSLTWDGMLSASKQAMMTPFVCWLAAATYMRLKLNVARSVGILVGTTLCFTLFTQISTARDRIPEGITYGEHIHLLIDELTHYGDLVASNKQVTDPATSLGEYYYSTPQNALIMRLSMLPPDDSFFHYASDLPPAGIDTVFVRYRLLVPNFLLPTSKAPIATGNHYAHLIGGYLSPDDDTTGISFSPVPEAYYLAGWTGIFLVLPAIWLLMFLGIDFVCGDFKKAPWGLLVIVYLGHLAPESLLGGLIYYTGYGNFAMVVAIVFCTRLAPVLGALFASSSLHNSPTSSISTRLVPLP